MGVRAAPTMAMGSFCKMSLLGVVDAMRRALVPSVAPLSLQTRRRRDPACLLALGRDSCSGLAAIASRPADKVSIAIGADAVERVGAGGAESTFVAADECTILVGRKRPRASLTSLAHFESHIVPIRPWSSHRYFVSLNSSRPISIRLISEVPAPISYSLASRHRRPVAYSLM